MSTYAAANPFRFATKYADTETGLVQYNTRYYSPGMGRFVNRDPLGEQGGHNLYAYVRNNAINRWDYLGMVDGVEVVAEDGGRLSVTSRLEAALARAIAERSSVARMSRSPADDYLDKISGQIDESPIERMAADAKAAFIAEHQAMGEAIRAAHRVLAKVEAANLARKANVYSKPAQVVATAFPAPNSVTSDLSLAGISRSVPIGPPPGPGQLASLGIYALATVDPRTGATTRLVSSDGGPIYAPASYNAAANVAVAHDIWWPPTFRSLVQGGGPWDYKRIDPSYEHLGNFNYGLTGAATGLFPDRVLLRQAGDAQISAGTSNPAYGGPGYTPLGIGASGSFGDDPRDQADIRLGISTNDNRSTVTTVRVGYFGPPGG